MLGAGSMVSSGGLALIRYATMGLALASLALAYTATNFPLKPRERMQKLQAESATFCADCGKAMVPTPTP